MLCRRAAGRGAGWATRPLRVVRDRPTRARTPRRGPRARGRRRSRPRPAPPPRSVAWRTSSRVTCAGSAIPSSQQATAPTDIPHLEPLDGARVHPFRRHSEPLLQRPALLQLRKTLPRSTPGRRTPPARRTAAPDARRNECWPGQVAPRERSRTAAVHPPSPCRSSLPRPVRGHRAPRRRRPRERGGMRSRHRSRRRRLQGCEPCVELRALLGGQGPQRGAKRRRARPLPSGRGRASQQPGTGSARAARSSATSPLRSRTSRTTASGKAAARPETAPAAPLSRPSRMSCSELHEDVEAFDQERLDVLEWAVRDLQPGEVRSRLPDALDRGPAGSTRCARGTRRGRRAAVRRPRPPRRSGARATPRRTGSTAARSRPPHPPPASAESCASRNRVRRGLRPAVDGHLDATRDRIEEEPRHSSFLEGQQDALPRGAEREDPVQSARDEEVRVGAERVLVERLLRPGAG